MRQTRADRCSGSKDTRWDRIRKRYSSNNTNVSLKSDAVRRFIEMDFIGRQQDSMLRGEKEAIIQLDPVLVMDMRHQMKIPRKLPLATVGGMRNMDACVVHNQAVEERYIANELNKFRQQLEKQHKRSKLKTAIKEKAEKSLQLDNELLMQSLEATSRHIEDFYAAPLAALEQNELLCTMEWTERRNDNKENEANENEVWKVGSIERTDFGHEIEDGVIKSNEVLATSERFTNGASTNAEESLMSKESADTLKNDQQKIVGTQDQNAEFPHAEYEMTCKCCISGSVAHNSQQSRCVRFEEAVEIHKFQRENSNCSSNTSDGIDSVISDLAEEALFELQMEEEAKIIEATQQTEVVEHGGEILKTVEHNTATPTAQADNANTDNKLLIVKRIELSRLADNDSKKDVLSTSDETTEEESVSNHEQNRIIEQLFQSRAHTNMTTLRKYFLKWIHYTTIAKIEREHVSSKNDRIHKINVFLDKIRKEKLRMDNHRHECKAGTGEQQKCESRKKPVETVKIAKKYQNKIKVQQDIIDLQRIKLERQERLIMQLKLHKLSDEAKEARDEIKNELKTVIRSGDPKAKAKAKCLQLIGNLRDAEDEEFARLQGKALLMPKFLQHMQERALERNIRHEQARQRRLQQEAEKEAQKIAAEEAKRLEDEEAKRQRIEALKEKRRQEKMAKIIRERERQRALESKTKSEAFCRHLLLRRVGMEGFKRLLQRKRDNYRKCEVLRRNLYKRTYFVAWRDYYIELCEEKLTRAENLYQHILQRNAMAAWKFYVQGERSKYHVAIDWCDLKLTDRIFKHWQQYTSRMSLMEATKMHQAAAHHEWHLKWKVLDCWQRLPQILQLEKETEERRQRWRMKIWELLPDYTPNRDND